MENSKPLLSVCLITYNHDKFIAQAIEGVLMQKINFSWEFIIAEDCSTDCTRSIIKAYAEKYPNLIKFILQEKNVGAAKNWLDLISSPTGKYVAYFEGDDYWTDPYKLQKQVDFLEANPDFVMCFHNVEVMYENDRAKNFYYCSENQKEITTLPDLLAGNFIPTCSAIFRNNLFSSFPPWFFKLKLGDWTLHILNAQHGKIKYINEAMGVYRIHDAGIWSSRKQSTNIVDILKVLDVLYIHLGVTYRKKIQNSKFKYLSDLYFEYRKEKKRIKCIETLLQQVSIWHGFLLKREFYKKLLFL